MPPLSRLQQLLQHLNPAAAPEEQGQLSSQECAARSHALPRFDVEYLAAYLDEYKDLKNEIYGKLESRQDLLVATVEGLTKEEHRELVRKTLRALLADGHKPMTYYSTDLKKYFYFGELMALVDLSLTIKMGVQYSLWGGSIFNLGTEKHKQKYLEDIDNFKLPGGFAMTELRHGSNVAALQTEAVLDPTTDEWVITTPDEGAIKWWIGNAAEDGRMASVFARLRVPASDGSGAVDDHGVHAFVVPLRDAEGNCVPGVEIRDCGYKVGLQGVDNGSLRFSGVRIPRENLLDRFGTVDSTGQYRSPFSMNRRFAATLGELTGGRVGLCCSSLAVLKGSVTIAVRYGATRQQFGPPDAPEVAVLDYSSQQKKLMPMLATAYALHFTARFLVSQYAESKQTKADDLVADVHSLSAGLKAYITEYTANALSVCRAACGGHGYAAVNRFGAWRSDHDIFQTFEGDNCVLLQQVAGLLLKKYAEKFKGAPLQATYAYLRTWATDNLPANPLVSHETKVSHLRDAAFLSRALKYRVARLLHTVALRLRKHTQRKGAFQAWNRCLGHLLALARAHIESVIHSRLSLGVTECQDPEARKSLKAMADIFALGCIQSDVMFRNDDYIAAEKVKAINKLMEDLCRELRAMAVPLVDAFAIPDHILRAPIGLSSYLKDPYAEYLSSIGWQAPLTGAATQ